MKPFKKISGRTVFAASVLWVVFVLVVYAGGFAFAVGQARSPGWNLVGTWVEVDVVRRVSLQALVPPAILVLLWVAGRRFGMKASAT